MTFLPSIVPVFTFYSFIARTILATHTRTGVHSYILEMKAGELGEVFMRLYHLHRWLGAQEKEEISFSTITSSILLS